VISLFSLSKLHCVLVMGVGGREGHVELAREFE